jgi:hypothetical protein
MLDHAIPKIEPFMERVEQTTDSSHQRTYRLGYRIAQTMHVLSAVIIPADVIEPEFTTGLSLSITMSPAGIFSAELVSPDGYAIDANSDSTANSIEHLVAGAVDTRNLCLEEAGAIHLKTLCAQLERSIILVKNALSQIDETPGSK